MADRQNKNIIIFTFSAFPFTPRAFGLAIPHAFRRRHAAERSFTELIRYTLPYAEHRLCYLIKRHERFAACGKRNLGAYHRV